MIRRLLILMSVLTALSAPPAVVRAASPDGLPSPRLFQLDAVEIHGLVGTPAHRVREILGLVPGEQVAQTTIVDAVAVLENAGLLSNISYYTRAGAERGHIVLVLEVEDSEEDRSEVSMRMGAGNSDNDGWYWIPLQVDFGPAIGDHTQIGIRLALGYRFSELSGLFRRALDSRERTWWGATIATRTSRRFYVLDGLEVEHGVDRGFAGLDFGHRFDTRWTLTTQLRQETADPEDHAVYTKTSEYRGVDEGQRIEPSDLPSAISSAIGPDDRTVFDGSLVYDGREQRRIAFSPAGGVRIGMRVRVTRAGQRTTPLASLDLRAYHAMLGGVLGWRARGAATTSEAPFYDRLYLGGLYTVRGVPSHSLTAPGGGTWLWNSTVEFRAPLSGNASDPRLAGSLFLDLGQSGEAVNPHGRDLAASFGWGLRWRPFGVILGADFAVPVTGSPVEEFFHGNVSIGWSF